MKGMKLVVHSIKWDGVKDESYPNRIEFDLDESPIVDDGMYTGEMETVIGKWLSEHFGWVHDGFSFFITTK